MNSCFSPASGNLDYTQNILQYGHMKRINIFLLILALITALNACVTTKKAAEEEFIVDLNSPKIAIGEIDVQFDFIMGIAGIKKYSINVSYFPKEDAVCLEYKHDFMTYHQFWSRSGRRIFSEALKKYNEDYDASNLARNSRNSKKAYGSAKGYLTWQQFTFSVLAMGNMNVEFGYIFKDRAPYFSVNQMKAEFIEPNELFRRDNNRTSQVITLYFTRAQAAALEVLFDQHYLNGLSPGSSSSRSTSGVDRDDY